tara:strand:+ start:886 stop:1116 length:231 start_codon:yes stop_codon:yes gene_type:complete
MKKLFILAIFVFFMSCDETPKTPPQEPSLVDIYSCKVAKDYIFECVGFRPHLQNCNETNTKEILATPCDEITNIWR